MKHLTNYRIEFGKLESNEPLHENGGWANGKLISPTGKTFSVGGGWIHDESGASHYNNCHGFSYSGGGPNPYRQALSAGGFESYKGEELGDVDEVYASFGFDTEDHPNQCEEIYNEIIELNNEAWNDYDVSENPDYLALVYSTEELAKEISNEIEDDDSFSRSEALIAAAKLKGTGFSVEEDGEDENEDEEGRIFKTVERQLFGNEILIASWTVCACGFYVNKQGNPNHTIGWNVEEDTHGGDGVSRNSVLYKILDEIYLLDEATELPEIDEPEHEEPSEDGEYCFQVKNPCTPGMEDWETRARFDTEKGAEDYEAEFWRGFYSANSANSYGPETQIVKYSEVELETI
jgi:hypothetical protein